MNARAILRNVLSGYVDANSYENKDVKVNDAVDEALYFLLKDFDVIPKTALGQRQDSLTDQMQDVIKQAVNMGCYDAHDWLIESFHGQGCGND